MKMKDKKGEQIKNKKKHLEARKAAKERRRVVPRLERPGPGKAVKPEILIVCEGEKTEPSYFRQFRLASATIKTIGEGYNTVSLVSRAAELRQQGEYEQVWCVFDKDDFSDEDFNNAITMAEAEGISVAYSNQAFEYWIILHFEDHQGARMHRSRYAKKINRYLSKFGERYDEDQKIVTEGIFAVLEGRDLETGRIRRDLAIQRARRIYDRLDHRSRAKEESSTKVFAIVEEILKYI